MRLFVAISFTKEIKEKLVELQNKLKSEGVKGNYSYPENIHITLAFIGETDRVTEARKCVAAAGGSPFDISVSGTGYFGSIFWAGIEKNPNLENLAYDIRNALISKGFKIDDKPFKPHITLIREASKKARADISRCEMKVDEIKLMKSERINGRLTYTCIYSKKLENIL